MSTIRFTTLRAFGAELAEAVVAQRAPGEAPPRDVTIEELRSLPASLSPKAKHRLAVLLGTLTKTQQPKAESSGVLSPLQARIAALTGALEPAQVRAQAASVPLNYAAGSTGCVTRAVGKVAAVSVFPDGRMVTLSNESSAKTWDAKGVSLAQTWDGQAGVTALSGGRLATRAFADSDVNIFDEQYNRVAQLKGHSNNVTGVGELPDGSLVTTSDDGTMKVWDTSYACTLTNKLNWVEVAKLAVLTNGNLALCTRVGKLVICEPNGRVLSLHEDRTYVSVTGLSDGRFAAGTDGGRVQIFGRNGVRLNELTGHTGAVRSIVELPGGHLATGSATGTTKIWDSAGQCICTLDGHKGGVTSLACLADGRIVSASIDGTVRIWSFGP